MNMKISVLIITRFVLLTSIAKTQYQVMPNEKGNNYYVNPVFAGDYPELLELIYMDSFL